MTTFEQVGPPAVEHDNCLTRGLIVGLWLALFLSANAVLVLCYGAMGIAGSSLFTGGFLVAAEIGILLVSFRRDAVLLPADYLFVAFLFCIAASYAINGQTAGIKEYALLAISLAAYPTCRLIPWAMLRYIRFGLVVATAGIVAIGTAITAASLATQWYDPYGKPVVFGFHAAATHFVGAMAFLAIALATLRLAPRRTAAISALLFLPAAVFAASQVRFAFVALIASLCLGAILNRSDQRRHVVIIIAVVMAGIAAGAAARFDTTKVYLSYAVEVTDAPTQGGSSDSPLAKAKARAKPPSCTMDVNMDNSIAVRAALLRDAFYLVPFGDLFGVGLDSFMALSCIKATEVHNSVLQSLIEFGWLGGGSLVLLVLVAGGLLLPLARDDADIRFVLCSVAYVAISSLVYGRVSRDYLLLALLGLAVGVHSSVKDRNRRPQGARIAPAGSAMMSSPQHVNRGP